MASPSFTFLIVTAKARRRKKIARWTPLGAGGGNVFTCLRAYVFTLGNDNMRVLSPNKG